jgi:DNA-binding NarL/FixJ family response regulator
MNHLAPLTTKLISNHIRILLTEREMTILHLISHEYSDKQIANELFLSHHTIHTHRKNLMSKLDVTKSTGLVRRGFELGFLE